MVGILIFGVVLITAYLIYWVKFCKRIKIQNNPINVKLRISKEFQDLILGPCKFRLKIGERGNVLYKMKRFEPCDDNETILIVIEKVDGKEKK